MNIEDVTGDSINCNTLPQIGRPVNYDMSIVINLGKSFSLPCSNLLDFGIQSLFLKIRALRASPRYTTKYTHRRAAHGNKIGIPNAKCWQDC